MLFDPVLDSSLDDFVNQQVKAAQMLFSTGIQGFFGDFKVYFENEIDIAFSCIKCFMKSGTYGKVEKWKFFMTFPSRR